ncbi:MAG TPA: RNA-binding protein [Brevundimonas sp.]|uniref:RNA-binding protein n=1 Tax=Brevundimonas sp. TaxID=1871086 RepID=UPI002C12516B|nr:RNA-binding protein [Brevundimonas sp.]HRH19080.1 RNA-binding protein [Brevundimonas sp.]
MTRKTPAIERERKDLVTGQVMDEACLIRFVPGPDGEVVPDLGRKLPGRGLWVEASRQAVDTASKKGLFARAAKATVKAPADLSDRIEILLMRRCLDQLGLARREGVLISGFEKCHQALKAGRAAWLIEASDGSEDGRTKLLGAVEKSESGVQVCGVFSSSDLGLALGLENAIHHVLPVGRRAERWAFEARRLAGFRPLLPSEWRGRD